MTNDGQANVATELTAVAIPGEHVMKSSQIATLPTRARNDSGEPVYASRAHRGRSTTIYAVSIFPNMCRFRSCGSR